MKKKESVIKHAVKKHLIRKVSAAGTSGEKKEVVKLSAKRMVSKEIKEKSLVEIVSLSNLKSPIGSRKKRKLLGRGSSSGHGKTSTRGSKGQTSRAGRHFY